MQNCKPEPTIQSPGYHSARKGRQRPVGICWLVAVWVLTVGWVGCRDRVHSGVATTDPSVPGDRVAAEDTPANSDEAAAASGPQQATPAEPPATSIPSVEVHPEAEKYTETQLGKDHTLCVQAFDRATRQIYFLSHYRPFMEDHQVQPARDLIDSYDMAFRRLGQQRNLILENATDDQDIATLLLNNGVETLLLSREVRRRIVREVLTREQRRAHQEAVAFRRQQAAEHAEPAIREGGN